MIHRTETSKAKILFCQISENAEGVRVYCKSNDEQILFGYGTCTGNPTLPQGEWQILSTLKDVTEEQAKVLFPTFYDEFNDETIFCFEDNFGTMFVEKAIDCLLATSDHLGLSGDKNYVILYELKQTP